MNQQIMYSNIDKAECKRLIANGKLTLVHLYEHKDVLHPRGPMKKESVGAYLWDRLKGCYDDWTDPEYADNPSQEELLERLRDNLFNETTNAFEELLAYVASKKEIKDNEK